MSQQKNILERLLDVFAPPYLPIYIPMLISFCIFAIGIIVASTTGNMRTSDIIFGVSSLVFALSGIYQFKLKIVPGYPSLQGGCAVVFGILFLGFFLIMGVCLIFFT
jgi:hypothetical protein